MTDQERYVWEKKLRKASLSKAVFIEGYLETTAGASGGLADDQFWFDHGFAAVGVCHGTANAAQQSFGGYPAHFAQRLTHGGKRGILVGRALDVVEAHYRNIIGNAQLCLSKRADGAHR